MMTRRPFSLLSATLCGLALGASVLLAGCGGGSSSGGGNGGGGTSLASFNGTYTSSVVINGYTHTETDTVSNGTVTSHHAFTNGSQSGTFDWTGTAILSASDSTHATITGSGTINNIGVRPFTLTSGNIDLNSDGSATLNWSATDPTFGGIGGTTTRAANGGGNSSASLAAGSYQGVYLYASGPSSPDAGTVAFTVTPSGGVNGTTMDYTGDGSTSNFTGTVNSNGSVTTNGGAVSSPFVQSSTTHVYSTSVTQADGTKGPLSVGLAPTASPLAGSYSGTFANSTQQFPGTLTISATGVVTGTLGTPAVANQGSTFSGYVDTNGNLYLADISGGVPENLFATLTLNGTSLTGPVHTSAADGSSATGGTLSMTKQ